MVTPIAPARDATGIEYVETALTMSGEAFSHPFPWVVLGSVVAVGLLVRRRWPVAPQKEFSVAFDTAPMIAIPLVVLGGLAWLGRRPVADPPLVWCLVWAWALLPAQTGATVLGIRAARRIWVAVGAALVGGWLSAGAWMAVQLILIYAT